MKRVSQDFRELGLLINLLVVIGFVVLVVKAFAPDGQPSLAQADMVAAGPTVVAATATALPPTAPATVAPTATPLPPATATAVSNIAAPATVSAAVTVTVAATVASTTTNDAAPAADAANPPVASAAVVDIVNKGTCNACHAIPGVAGAVGIVGPNLANIGAEAGTRIPGYSAEQYLHESIVDPNAFIAPKCPFGSCTPGAMPATLAQTLTPEEIQTMVDYLLTLHSPQ